MNEVFAGFIGAIVLVAVVVFLLKNRAKRKLAHRVGVKPSPQPAPPDEIELPPPASDPLNPRRPRPRHPREK